MNQGCPPTGKHPMKHLDNALGPLVCRLALGILILSCIAGCGSRLELGQVEGTLQYQNRPLSKVLVTFVPAREGDDARVRSMGETDEQGRFSLTTETREKGAVLGEHVVILEDLAIYEAPRSEDGTVLKIPRERFPSKYKDAIRSPLKVTVTTGQQEVELKVLP